MRLYQGIFLKRAKVLSFLYETLMTGSAMTVLVTMGDPVALGLYFTVTLSAPLVFNSVIAKRSIALSSSFRLPVALGTDLLGMVLLVLFARSSPFKALLAGLALVLPRLLLRPIEPPSNHPTNPSILVSRRQRLSKSRASTAGD